MPTKTLLCYGDSNTYGTTPVLNPQQNNRHPFGERWPDVAQTALGNGWRVIAEGMPGRTTRHDDPLEAGESRNGSRSLRAILESHQPIDMVAIMLGTNDLKACYNVDAEEIARSVGMLIGQIESLGVGPQQGIPEVLVLSPLPLNKALCHHMFTEGVAVSQQLATALERMAARFKVHFFDLATVATCDGEDGLHFSSTQHALIGKAVADYIAKR